MWFEHVRQEIAGPRGGIARSFVSGQRQVAASVIPTFVAAEKLIGPARPPLGTTMNIASFIESNIEVLLTDWTEQARHLGVAGTPAAAADLEDSARSLLRQICVDLAQEQSDAQRDEKGKGQRPGNAPGITQAARTHAEERLAQGFALPDLVAEFRAVRASVVRHWLVTPHGDGETALRELVRFDEAVDQALTESIACYSAAIDRIRELFVGILAHDLRTPLGAVYSSAQYLLKADGLPEKPLRAAGNIQRSCERMQRIIGDLLDFTRSRLGGILPVTVEPGNLGKVCEHALAEIGALHPTEDLRWSPAGDLAGEWDSARLSELLVNLLENAIDHGRPGGQIRVAARGLKDQVSVSVSNEGDPIPSEHLHSIFDPLKRLNRPEQAPRAGAGLGLGLFIARQIALAHGGSIEVASADVTTFTVTLPRVAAQSSGTSASDPARNS